MRQSETNLEDQGRPAVEKSERTELTNAQTRFAEVLGRLLADRWRENSSHTHQADRFEE